MSEAQRTAPRTERWALYGLLVLVLYASVRAAFTAYSKFLWFDELFTLIVARLPDLKTLGRALWDGLDSQGPLFDVIERVAVVVPNHEVGLRLPSILAFGALMVCVFAFVRRRSGPVCGLIAAAMTILINVYTPYAMEARAYCLVAAAIALAMVAYQRASSLLWAAVLAAALAGAVGLHYYAIFAVLPFVAAEAVFFWQSARLRWGVWIALALGACSLALVWPLLARFKAINGGHFWARPTLLLVREFYGEQLNVMYFWGLGLCIVSALAVVGVLSAVLRRGSARSGDDVNEFSSNPLYEGVLIGVLLLSPVTVFIAAKVAHGGYMERYMLYAVDGFLVAPGLIAGRLGRRAVILFALLVASALAVREGSFWFSPIHPLLQLDTPAPIAERMLRSAGHEELPVFAADALTYLELLHYAPKPVADRLVWIADAPAALRYENVDSIEKSMVVLNKWFPLRLYDFQTFETAYPAFLFYITPAEISQGHFEDWWTQRLVDDGFDLRLAATENNHFLFLVTRAQSSR